MKTILLAALGLALLPTVAFARPVSGEREASYGAAASDQGPQPASTIRVAASETKGHGGDHAVGIAAEGGFARAMLPGARTGGGYLTLRNATATDDRLLDVASPRAGRVELHRTEMNGAVMTMREVENGLPVAAGGSVTLVPGGTHLMFLDVAKPFTEGERIPLTLRFEKAGSVETELLVGPPNAAAPAAGGHAH